MSEQWEGIPCDWHQAPDDTAKVQAARVVAATRAAGVPPERAATGKWQSVCLFWSGLQTEVEVFDDRFELYFFPRTAQDAPFSVDDFAADAAGLERVVEAICARAGA